MTETDMEFEPTWLLNLNILHPQTMKNLLFYNFTATRWAKIKSLTTPFWVKTWNIKKCPTLLLVLLMQKLLYLLGSKEKVQGNIICDNKSVETPQMSINKRMDEQMEHSQMIE